MEHIEYGQPWKYQSEHDYELDISLGEWVTDGSLPDVISYSQAIVTKDRVYLLEGVINDSYPSAVYTATINADGTLGTWTTAGNLPVPLATAQAIVTRNRVYLLGGYIDGFYSSTVHTAPINADGSLGTWTTGTSLPVALGLSQAIVTKNRVYLLGGYDGSGWLSTVHTAPINTDGTLGAWTTATSLPVALGGSQAIVTKNRVYLLGGYIDDSYLSVIYTAPINADGTLGTWTTVGNLPGTIYDSQAIVTKNRVYLLGGYDGSNWLSTVHTAPINTDGTLGAWSTTASLPGAVGESQAIVTRNRIYLLGGCNSNGYTPTIFSAPIIQHTDPALNFNPNLTNVLNQEVKYVVERPHFTKESKIKIYELKSQQLEQIASTEPYWVFNNRLDWMVTNLPKWVATHFPEVLVISHPELVANFHPEWMVKNHLDYMVENRPDWMITNCTEWMAINRFEWVAINHPDLIADSRPEWVVSVNPKWMAENRPDYMAKNHTKYMAENRPDWMVANCFEQIFSSNPKWVADNYPEETAKQKPDWMFKHHLKWVINNHREWTSGNSPSHMQKEVPEEILKLIKDQ